MAPAHHTEPKRSRHGHLRFKRGSLRGGELPFPAPGHSSRSAWLPSISSTWAGNGHRVARASTDTGRGRDDASHSRSEPLPPFRRPKVPRYPDVACAYKVWRPRVVVQHNYWAGARAVGATFRGRNQEACRGDASRAAPALHAGAISSRKAPCPSRWRTGMGSLNMDHRPEPAWRGSIEFLRPRHSST
jgi:hypothetical protein